MLVRLIINFRLNNLLKAFFLLLISTSILLIYRLWFSLAMSQFITSSLHLDNVRQLIRASDDSGVSCVLFDPTILQAYQSNTPIINNNNNNSSSLIFALNYQELNANPTFVDRLRQLGFMVTTFTNSKDNKTHIFLQRNGSPIHIIVLHWQNAGYYRQYQVMGSSQEIKYLEQYFTKSAWRTLNMDRAYKSFEKTEVTLDTITIVIPRDIDEFVTSHASAQFIPCNYTRAQEFQLKFPEEKYDMKQQSFIDKSWRILDESRAILNDLEIPFFLTCGTLLGYFRQCDIFHWALDVDIAVFIEDYSDLIVPAFEKKGLKHKHTYGLLSDSFELSFSFQGIKIDIFFYYTDGFSMWYGALKRNGDKFKYVSPSFTLCWTEFLGMFVRIPCEIDEHIEINYGPDWFNPHKKWDYGADHPNAIENGRWPKELWPQVMQKIAD